MDPYIEACHLWDDFHSTFIIEMKKALATLLPEAYVARTGERSYITLTAKNGEDEYRMQADATIAKPPRAPEGTEQQGSVAVLEDEESAPVTMRAMIKTEFREAFLDIRQVHGDREVITSLEVLSPSNKRFGSEGWFEYLRKRQACLSGLVNFVEIDLLRRGRRMPMDDDWPESPYYLLVSKKAEAPRCKVWKAFITRPLPEIRIPLAPPDSDISLPLQPLVDAVYAYSRYDKDIDYRQQIRPPLSPGETACLEEGLSEHPKN